MNEHTIWNKIYEDTIHPHWGKEQPDPLLKDLVCRTLPLINKESISVLDIGCGNGRNARIFTPGKSPLISYTGVDFSQRAVEYCQETQKEFRFKQHDMTTSLTAFDRPFDLVIDFGCFHAIVPEKRHIHVDNIVHQTGEKGYFILGAWYSPQKQIHLEKPAFYPYDVLAEWFFNEEDIKEIFAPHFTLKSFSIGHEKPHDINHGLLYCVLQKN